MRYLKTYCPPLSRASPTSSLHNPRALKANHRPAPSVSSLQRLLAGKEDERREKERRNEGLATITKALHKLQGVCHSSMFEFHRTGTTPKSPLSLPQTAAIFPMGRWKQASWLPPPA
ncbi:hypothetical protein KIL84_006385 [Mauremys mutica]|uniref:Uncharacterized protein n=1 Tax=Mauremys mutica TaxID=74926 RepID=A0A9D3WZ83_9SAUR|nr:hypothetical protein KIL84_006385 [Mauremys mutica]